MTNKIISRYLRQDRKTVAFGIWFLFLSLCLAGNASWAFTDHPGQPAEDTSETLDIYGHILNPHGSGVADADVEILVNGIVQEPLVKDHHGHGKARITTESDGSFQATIGLAKGTLPGAEIKIRAFKPSYEKTEFTVPSDQIAMSGSRHTAKVDVQIKRSQGPAFWIATVVFVLAYVLISFELLHRRARP